VEPESLEPGPIELVVGPDGAGARLDAFLATSVPSLSRTRAHRAVEEGDVLVNGTLAKAAQKLRVGDRVDVELPTPPPSELVPQDIDLAIVYEDEDIAVVDKPSGLVVHPGAGVSSGTLANALAFKYGTNADLLGVPASCTGSTATTSGLLVVARSEAAHTLLSEQFQRRTVTKRYLALVYGRVGAESGELVKPIGRHPNVRGEWRSLARGAVGRRRRSTGCSSASPR
jgi:23S rRNA pseudouridine1911/1915/1917 synthase